VDVPGAVGLLVGVQYDPNPVVSQNHYLVLWNRLPGFAEGDLDRAAYQERTVTECAAALKRNMFFVRTCDLALVRAATRGIRRWGTSNAEAEEQVGSDPEARRAEESVLAALERVGPLTRERLWAVMGLEEDWRRYREEAQTGLPAPGGPVAALSRKCFRAFSRLARRGDLVVTARLPGAFRPPVYGLSSRLLPDTARGEPDETTARRWLIRGLLDSYGVATGSLLTFVSGLAGVEVRALLAEAVQTGEATPVEIRGGPGVRTGRAWASPAALDQAGGNRAGAGDRGREAPPFCALLPPLDNALRHLPSIKALFGYSFEMEYFKKKGMRWQLSALIGEAFAGWVNCAADRRAGVFRVRSRELGELESGTWAILRTRVEELARFHGAKSVEWNV
jgi:hypothetical protein